MTRRRGHQQQAATSLRALTPAVRAAAAAEERMKRTSTLLLLLPLLSMLRAPLVDCSSSAEEQPHLPLYKDAAAPIPERVQDLLARMTTEEKVAQLLELWGGEDVFTKLLKSYNRTGVGAVMIGGGAPNSTCQNSPSCRVRVQNELQRQMIEGTRLGIPITFTQETMTSGSHNGTSFPHPVAQGSSWNMTLVHEIAKAVAEEAFYSGVDRCGCVGGDNGITKI
jgi:beta-glucosidase